MPFKTDPESFGQRILTQLHMRYMTVAEFDDLIDNPNPISNVRGPDEECLYIEAPDLRRPQNPPKRTYLIGDYAPVSKLARWVDSWRAQGREFDAEHPETHDNEYAWISIRREAMGKYKPTDVWRYEGVPSAEEIAALPPQPIPAVASSSPQPSAQPAPAAAAPFSTTPATGIDASTVREAILLVCADGISPVALFAAVNEMVMAEVARADVVTARDVLLTEGKLRTEAGKLHAGAK